MIPHTRREYIYLTLVLISLVGMVLNSYAANNMIKDYQKATYECLQNIADYNSGYADVYGRKLNLTHLNITYEVKGNETNTK